MTSFLASFGSGSSGEVDSLIEKATAETNPVGSPNWAAYLDVADAIKSKQGTTPKAAVITLRGRLSHPNPNVQLFTLDLIDICIKNAGDAFVQLALSRDLLNVIVNIIKSTDALDVQAKALELIQSWALSFKPREDLVPYIQIVYTSLKRDSSYHFPTPPSPSLTAAAAVSVIAPPEWTDSDFCMRCRTSFSAFTRKHHCRRCGQAVCQNCSTNSIPLTDMGFLKPVRVCETCYDKVLSAKTTGDPIVGRIVSEDLSRSSSTASNMYPGDKSSDKSGATTTKTQEELDIELAIALSLKEQNIASASATSRSNVEDQPQYSIPPPPSAVETYTPSAHQSAKLNATTEQGPYVVPKLGISAYKAYEPDWSAPVVSSHSGTVATLTEASLLPPVVRTSSVASATVKPSADVFSDQDLRQTEDFIALIDRIDQDCSAHGIRVLNAPQLEMIYNALLPATQKLRTVLQQKETEIAEYQQTMDRVSSAYSQYYNAISSVPAQPMAPAHLTSASSYQPAFTPPSAQTSGVAATYQSQVPYDGSRGYFLPAGYGMVDLSSKVENGATVQLPAGRSEVKTESSLQSTMPYPYQGYQPREQQPAAGPGARNNSSLYSAAPQTQYLPPPVESRTTREYVPLNTTAIPSSSAPAPSPNLYGQPPVIQHDVYTNQTSYPPEPLPVHATTPAAFGPYPTVAPPPVQHNYANLYPTVPPPVSYTLRQGEQFSQGPLSTSAPAGTSSHQEAPSTQPSDMKQSASHLMDEPLIEL